MPPLVSHNGILQRFCGYVKGATPNRGAQCFSKVYRTSPHKILRKKLHKHQKVRYRVALSLSVFWGEPMSTKTVTFDVTSSAWKSATSLFNIFKQEAGYMLHGIHNSHELVFGGVLDGAVATVRIMAPAQQAWRAIATGQTISDIVTVNTLAQGIQVEFIGGGPALAPTVTLISKMRGI